MALCVALHLLLPGERRLGTQLPDGTRLTYKLNGARCCVAAQRKRTARECRVLNAWR
jgi:hypothetical protein